MLPERANVHSNAGTHPAQRILGSWNDDGLTATATAKLEAVVGELQEREPLVLLAHMLEVEKSAVDNKRAALLARLCPNPNKKPLRPSETALRVAKGRLWPDNGAQKRGGNPARLVKALAQSEDRPARPNAEDG